VGPARPQFVVFSPIQRRLPSLANGPAIPEPPASWHVSCITSYPLTTAFFFSLPLTLPEQRGKEGLMRRWLRVLSQGAGVLVACVAAAGEPGAPRRPVCP